MALSLLLIRHGETAYNAEGRYQGQTDIPLSEVGRDQVRRLAHRLEAVWQKVEAMPGLRALSAPPVAVYASDLGRAAETAAIVAEAATRATGRELPVRPLPLLRERGFGVWEGLTAAEIGARFPGREPPEGAETWPEVWARMDQALEQIWRDHVPAPRVATDTSPGPPPPPPVVLIVGHGGSLRAFLCRGLGVGPEHVRRFRLDNASLSLVELWGPSVAQSEGRVALLNDTAHLQG